jgi:hypothetical protein
MGADIYLRSINKAAKAEWEPRFNAAVERRNRLDPGTAEHVAAQALVDEAYEGMYGAGYFRDSYNSTRLFGLLDLSWWRSIDDQQGKGWSINSKGQMSIRSMRNLRRYLADRAPITATCLKSWERHNRGSATIDDGDNSLAKWAEMFERKRVNLIALLDQAVDLGEPLECSV